MEKCFYNGKEIYAIDIYKNLAYENQIRKAGRNGELKCGDNSCLAKVIYNYAGNKKDRIAKKVPYFSHYRPKTTCPYSHYFNNVKKRNEKMRLLINQCYLILKQQYPDYIIKREEKLVPNHWTDISVNKQNEIIAIEFINGYKAPKYMSEMLDLYDTANIHTIIIFSDQIYGEEFEYDFNFAKRTQLNNSNGMLIIIDKNDNVKLIKVAPSQYENFNKSSLFIFNTDFPSLDLIDNPNYHSNFENGFKDFIAKRKAEYEARALQHAKQSLSTPKLMPMPMKKQSNTHSKKRVFHNPNLPLNANLPLNIDTIKKLFNKYCYGDSSERTDVSNLFYAAYERDKETRENMIKLYRDSEKNDNALFIKLDVQFGTLIKSLE